MFSAYRIRHSFAQATAGAMAASPPLWDHQTAVPKTITGVTLHDPIRPFLLRAAQERGHPNNHVWATTAQLNHAKLQLRNDARCVDVPIAQGVRVSFWSLNDIVFPHNVSCWCVVGPGASIAHGSHRTLCGGSFSNEYSSQLDAAARRRGLLSRCWVSEAECRLLSWTPLPSASPEVMQRGQAALFNTQDIREAIDFSRFFFVDRRAYSVSNGKVLGALWTLQLRLQQDKALGLSSPSASRCLAQLEGNEFGDRRRHTSSWSAEDVADTEMNLKRMAAKYGGPELHILGTPVTVLTRSDDVIQLFTASQTSQPEALLRIAREKREMYLEHIRQKGRENSHLDGRSMA